MECFVEATLAVARDDIRVAMRATARVAPTLDYRISP